MPFEHRRQSLCVMALFEGGWKLPLMLRGELQPADLRPMTPAEYRAFLGSLKTDLARWRAQLAEIDAGSLSSLSVDSRIPELVEKHLSWARQAAKECQELASALERRQTLQGDLELYLRVETLAWVVGETYNEIMYWGSSSSKIVPGILLGRWLDDDLLGPVKMFQALRPGIDTRRKGLRHHLGALAGIADSSWPELRRYLDCG